MYLFKPTGLDDLDGWKNDGYKWKHQGVTRYPRNRTPLLQKRYFYIINRDGSSYCSRRKDVFCREAGTDPHHLVLIHYGGEIGKILDDGKTGNEKLWLISFQIYTVKQHFCLTVSSPRFQY